MGSIINILVSGILIGILIVIVLCVAAFIITGMGSVKRRHEFGGNTPFENDPQKIKIDEESLREDSATYHSVEEFRKGNER